MIDLPQDPRLEGLKQNLHLLDEADRKLIADLIRDDQAHLFFDWDPPGVADDEKRAFLDTLRRVDASYPGGLTAYIANARRLLAEAREGKNPFEGFTPRRPDTVDLTRFDRTYDQCEAAGVEYFDRLGVVLVAGGLGERLGYSGIKIEMPIEILLHTSYLAHYAACLRAIEARMKNPRPIPFVIMVSRDTDAPTRRLLEANDYFGLRPEQVRILRQETVPGIADNEGHLALDGKYRLVLKPHGHGDIHMLLHTSGTAAELARSGIEYLAFIQDTNAQVFNALPAALGVSVREGFDFNSLAVPRVPGEAVGGIARLVREDREITVNVEYNQLDPLLRATVNPEGDVAGPDGYSPFPGNTNVLLIRMTPYLRVLERTRGIIAEFVNPKYADETRTAFKKPTRLETMMQDLPKLFEDGEKVGVTVFDRRWSFSANKNNPADAAAKHAAGRPPESAATAESDFYHAGRLRLIQAGVGVEEAPERLFLGIPFTPGPKVILRPSFAMTLAEGREKIAGGEIRDEAALVLDGPDIRLEDVRLSGRSALVVKACPGARVTVRGAFENPGFELVELSEEELRDAPEYLRMRGYRFEDRGAAIFTFDRPGDYLLTPQGIVSNLD